MSSSVVQSRTRRVVLGAVAALVVAGAPALAADSTPVAGSAGIGDPYYADYGNGGYDVSSYDIAVTYAPPASVDVADKIVGGTTIRATATQSLKRFNLDLALTASQVKVDGVAATFSQPTRHELVVKPRTPIAEGTRFKIRVLYSGKPGQITSHGISPWARSADGGAVAVGEPEIAAWWFPSNDHPRDKATFDIRVTVPKGVEALSNGVLVSDDADTSEATATWHWRESRPMATYLAFFAAGQYDVQQSTYDGLPFITAIADGTSRSRTRAVADLARVPEVVDWEADKFGPYPFDAIGAVVPDSSIGFALENQTRPVYPLDSWDRGSDIGLVVHEMAHQWFGDSVAVKNWKHIWLNEGFASFAEWLWSEDHDGASAATTFKSIYQSTPASDSFWKLEVGDPGAGNEFDDAVYYRGGMTLQALRTLVGDPVFFDVLRSWTAAKKDGTATVGEFKALAEQKAGRDLDAFFTTWLYSSTRPAATVANGFPADFASQDSLSAKEWQAFTERQDRVRSREQ